MPDEISAAPAAPVDTSTPSSGTAETAAPAASSSPDTTQDLASLFAQAEQAAPASPDPSAPGAPAVQGQPAAPQGDPQAPAAPEVTPPPAGDTPAAPPATPPATAPAAPQSEPQITPEQQELARLRVQSETYAMAAELGIHPQQIPAWGQYAKDMGFENNIREAFAFNQEVEASKARIAQNEESLIQPYINDGYSEEDAKAAVKPMLEQFERTERMLVENMRVRKSSEAQLAEMRATEARVQQEAVQREQQAAIQYASEKLGGVTLPENTAKIFAGSPAESIRLLVDDMHTLFQSILLSEKSKWAAESQTRANTTPPIGADTGTSPASNPLANAAVNAPDLTTIFETNHRNGASAFG